MFWFSFKRPIGLHDMMGKEEISIALQDAECVLCAYRFIFSLHYLMKFEILEIIYICFGNMIIMQVD